MVNKITTPPTTLELIGKVNELVDDKQDIISDLTTIRSGAALGATAVQPADLANKQDKLTVGTGIDITNNAISVKYDNNTIKVNGSGQLYTDIEAYTAAEVQTIWESV